MSRALQLAAAGCFLIALLVACAVAHAVGPFDAWLAGGLLAAALAPLVP